jgi:hypothetical protein
MFSMAAEEPFFSPIRHRITLFHMTEIVVSTRANSFDTGVAAEYFILSRLYRQGIEAYVSQGNKKSVDIRVIQPDGTAVLLDVKAVRGYSSLVVNNVRPIAGHFIVFVIYNGKFEDVTTFPEVFIAPSTEVPAITKCWNEEKRVMKGSLASCKNRWDLLLKSRVFRPFYPFYGPLRGPSSNHPLCGW